MKQVEDLIKAQIMLEKAQKDIPPNLHRAAERLSKDTNIDYYRALGIVDAIITDCASSQKTPIQKVQKTSKPNFASRCTEQIDVNPEFNVTRGGNGGNNNPKNLMDIKLRIEKNVGDKKECYRAAYVLFRHVDHWISKRDLKGQGINLKIMDNKRKITACLPTGYIMQKGHKGYRAIDIRSLGE